MEYFVIACLMPLPIVLLTGWIRWWRTRRQSQQGRNLSLMGFVLGTASTLLAACTIAYGNTSGGFEFYDPALLSIYRVGLLTSLFGVIFALIGIGRRNALRWHAPILSLGMLLLWMTWIAGE